MKIRHHMGVDVAGMLRWKKLRGMIIDDDGHAMSHAECKAYLQQCLAEGKLVIPMSSDACPEWNYITGCPGHPVERYRLRASADIPGTWAVDKYVTKDTTEFTGHRIPML